MRAGQLCVVDQIRTIFVTEEEMPKFMNEGEYPTGSPSRNS